jgi:hypothetical protein
MWRDPSDVVCTYGLLGLDGAGLDSHGLNGLDLLLNNWGRHLGAKVSPPNVSMGTGREVEQDASIP